MYRPRGLELLAVSLVSTLFACGLRAEDVQKKPLTPDAVLRLEEISERVVVSPDGDWVSYVIKRALTSSRHGPMPAMFGNDRADVWVQNLNGGAPIKITEGERDDSGSWMPVWSPNSSRLVFLSTRGGNVGMWLWERATGEVRQISQSPVRLFGDATAPLSWISDHEIVCLVLPMNEKPDAIVVDVRARQIATREWITAWNASEPTANVLESGVSIELANRPVGHLIVVDVLEKRQREIGQGLNMQYLEVSPNRRYLAFLYETERLQPERDVPLRSPIRVSYSLGLVDISGRSIALSGAHAAHVVPDSFRWSPDSSEFAFLEDSTRSDSEGASGLSRILRCHINAHSCEFAASDLDATHVSPIAFGSPFLWSLHDDFLVRGRRKIIGQTGRKEVPASGLKWRSNADDLTRRDWWLIFGDGRSIDLTQQMTDPPAELFLEESGRSFVGVGDDRLWRFKLDGSAPQNLAASFKSPIDSIEWPSFVEGYFTNGDIHTLSEVVFSSNQEGARGLYRLKLGTDRIESLPSPSKDAAFVTFSPTYPVSIFSQADGLGSRLISWKSGLSGFDVLYEANSFLREFAEAETRSIQYQTASGTTLTAWVMLPVGYKQGTRYPFICWVYGGEVLGNRSPSDFQLNNPDTLNLQLLASHGYGVLFPSTPLGPEGEPANPIEEFPSSVLPAIDELIKMGVADPQRLGVMGHSYGGYATYCLLTRTARFRVAVSLAGPSDLISLYGAFEVSDRYSQHPEESWFHSYLAEASQSRMGAPPWADPQRYFRNSPVLFADRITTPLMIVQGDMDQVAIEQGEEMFRALYRQNKRAEFVRYWGEGHQIGDAPNVRDMWKRMYGWFDQFLKRDGGRANLEQ